MAVNTKNYTCDYCMTDKLEYKEINSIYLKGYIHTDDNLCRGEELGNIDICKHCYSNFLPKYKMSLLDKLKSIICRKPT